MKTEFTRVILDLSAGSAYEYNKNSPIPTVIEYGRIHSGKFQRGNISGVFSNLKLHDIIYCIKRGYTQAEIQIQVNLNYE